ncbi:MAG: hypothetical protein HIU93_14935 [Acidobacteria bacterium]|nr:hypothetical protein [Acidobacteriota bacterium]MBW4043489.1 hypothetical protein [Acidobacteriota bacterium]
MKKSMLIARQLLWQNRWLFALLMLWPYLMGVLLVASGSQLDPEDLLAILHQECIYALALVAVTASTQLGNEQRSRRIATVLAEAVSRGEYLAALWLTAVVPLLLFLTGFAITGSALAVYAGSSAGGVIFMALLVTVVGLWAAAASLLWSIFLPAVFASIAAIASVGLVILAGDYGVPGPGRLMMEALRTGFVVPRRLIVGGDVILSIASVAVIFAAAWWLFDRRDLNLTAE